MIFFRFRQIFIEKIARISKKCCTFALAFRASGCSAVGSALRSGRRGRAFESPHPDKRRNTEVIVFRLFLFIRCCFPSCVLGLVGFSGSVRKAGCNPCSRFQYYAHNLDSLNKKNGMSATPLNWLLKAFTLALNDSAPALVCLFTKKLSMVS